MFGRNWIKSFPDGPAQLETEESFLAQKIEVGVTAGVRINNGGKVARKTVGVTGVIQGKSEGDPQRDLGRSNDFCR